MPSAYSTDPNSNQSPADIANVNRLGKMQSGQNPGPQWEGAHSWETPHTNPYAGATTTPATGTPAGGGFQPGSIAANPITAVASRAYDTFGNSNPEDNKKIEAGYSDWQARKQQAQANLNPNNPYVPFNPNNPQSVAAPTPPRGGSLTAGEFAKGTGGNFQSMWNNYPKLDPQGTANLNNAREFMPSPNSGFYNPGQHAAQPMGALTAGGGSQLALRPSGQLAAPGGSGTPSMGPGKIVGLSPKGMAVAGGALTAASVANEMIPRSNGDTYGGQVVNNLRDTFGRMSTGAGIGATIGSVVPVIGNAVGAGAGAAAGGLYDIGKKFWDAGKEAVDYVKGGINSRQAIADSNRSLAAAGHPQAGATPSGTASPAPSTSLPAGLTITPNAGIMNGVETPKPTAQSQITPLNGISNGMPVAPGIVNNPAPVGQPAAPAAPAAPKQFTGPSAEEMAAFRKSTGTKFNPNSINDKLSLERMRAGEETFDSKQANAYRASHPEYRPGQYVKG